MQLEALLRDIPVLSTNVDLGVEVTGVSYDSRQVRPGHLFVAIPGFAADGHRFIPKALEQGAVAVLCQQPQPDSIPHILVHDSRAALAALGAAWYGYPRPTFCALYSSSAWGPRSA